MNYVKGDKLSKKATIIREIREREHKAFNIQLNIERLTEKLENHQLHLARLQDELSNVDKKVKQQCKMKLKVDGLTSIFK